MSSLKKIKYINILDELKSIISLFWNGRDDMSDYIISCCSTADLTKEHFEAIDVKYICFHYLHFDNHVY